MIEFATRWIRLHVIREHVRSDAIDFVSNDITVGSDVMAPTLDMSWFVVEVIQFRSNVIKFTMNVITFDQSHPYGVTAVAVSLLECDQVYDGPDYVLTFTMNVITFTTDLIKFTTDLIRFASGLHI